MFVIDKIQFLHFFSTVIKTAEYFQTAWDLSPNWRIVLFPDVEAHAEKV